MSGSPTKGKAVADAGDTPTAHSEASRRILGDVDEERKFAGLQARAARAGHHLLAVPSGYILLKGCASFHSVSLDTLASQLARREVEA
jgi:hypothetical protein